MLWLGVLGVYVTALDLIVPLDSKEQLTVIETFASQTNHVVAVQGSLAVEFEGEVALCGLKTHVLVGVQDNGIGINILGGSGGAVILAVCGKKQCHYERKSYKILFHSSNWFLDCEYSEIIAGNVLPLRIKTE